LKIVYVKHLVILVKPYLF